MKITGNRATNKSLVAIAVILFLLTARGTWGKDAATSALQAAVCQVVYPIDEIPAANGYQYIFLGNAFFINEDGYLITAAHLLGWFEHGGQPYILVGPPGGPRRLVQADAIAVDTEHDVAVLRATPNPFQGDAKLAYLPLSLENPSKGDAVLSASFRPPDVDNAFSGDMPLQDFARTSVLSYQFYRENGTNERELLLFTQDVVPGQSGSPLVAADSQGAIGVVVGKWLRPMVVPSGANGIHQTIAPGAALRIHYAISLLEGLHVSWHLASMPAVAAAAAAAQAAAPAQQTQGFSPPEPLSVVAAPYPPRALFGGEVVLDALIDADGKPTDIRVASGDSPFLEPALSAVQTWTFAPAHLDGRAVESRIGIVFQFPQSFLPSVVSREHKYAEPFADSSERGAMPVRTIDPDYPVNSIADGSVALYEVVDADGKITSTSVLRNVDSLTAPVSAATLRWQFAPGKQAGAKTESGVVVVATFRRPT